MFLYFLELKIVDPETKTFAPAFIASLPVSRLIPPSTQVQLVCFLSFFL